MLPLLPRVLTSVAIMRRLEQVHVMVPGVCALLQVTVLHCGASVVNVVELEASTLLLRSTYLLTSIDNLHLLLDAEHLAFIVSAFLTFKFLHLLGVRGPLGFLKVD